MTSVYLWSSGWKINRSSVKMKASLPCVVYSIGSNLVLVIANNYCNINITGPRKEVLCAVDMTAYSSSSHNFVFSSSLFRSASTNPKSLWLMMVITINIRLNRMARRPKGRFGEYARSHSINLLTYSMVQSPSWEANWFAASQEIPRILWNPKVHYSTHKPPPPVPILDQPNPVHISTSHLLEIHPNIIPPIYA